jgi:hypothetical protein
MDNITGAVDVQEAGASIRILRRLLGEDTLEISISVL